MIRPALSNFVIGHWLGVTLTTSVALFTAAAWATQEQRHESISWFVPAVALLLCKASIKARRRVLQYRNWRGAWDEMAGPAPQQTPQPRRRRPLRVLLGAAIAIALFGWLHAHALEPITPTYQAAALAFVPLGLWSGIAAVSALVRLAFRPRRQAAAARPARREREDEHIVEVCPPVPRAAPRAEDTIAALPAYAKALLTPGAAATAEQAPSPGK